MKKKFENFQKKEITTLHLIIGGNDTPVAQNNNDDDIDDIDPLGINSITRPRGGNRNIPNK